MTAFVHTTTLVRPLPVAPEPLAARATAFLAAATELLLTDLIAAETVDVLGSFYETPRVQVAEAMRFAFRNLRIVAEPGGAAALAALRASLAERLAELDALRADGTITQSEHDVKRARILDEL